MQKFIFLGLFFLSTSLLAQERVTFFPQKKTSVLKSYPDSISVVLKDLKPIQLDFSMHETEFPGTDYSQMNLWDIKVQLDSLALKKPYSLTTEYSVDKGEVVLLTTRIQLLKGQVQSRGGVEGGKSYYELRFPWVTLETGNKYPPVKTYSLFEECTGRTDAQFKQIRVSCPSAQFIDYFRKN